MKPTSIPPSRLDGVARRRRSRRALDLFSSVPELRSAAAMDDAAEAQQLIDDLVALIDAGLIAPVHDGGETRYALTDPDDLTA